ncbi:MAG: hypothetical protein HFE61_05755 [Anaerotignum sp.]|jgi:hypothetical protein|nr:hypothetical protein [Anaerotignum sp.]
MVVNILGLVLIIGAIALYMYTIDRYRQDSEEVKTVRKLMICLILPGAGIILINSWIIKPILSVLGD